jgi:hypothetical protein
MKKLLTLATLAALTLAVCLHAQYGYDGPMDEIWWAHRGEPAYRLACYKTTLGHLARYSDIIGIGCVSGKTNDHFTVTIDHALVGCTNGADIVLYASYEDWGDEYPEEMLEDYLPTNLVRIVFAARTNVYNVGSGKMFWNHAEIPVQPDYVEKHPSLFYLNRSWWHVDRDYGLLLTQFTNVLQAVRFDRNWTNYFYLCRDGANSPSNRVREDSFRDLRILSLYSTDPQSQFIVDDPLVDPKHKRMILVPNWRYPSEDY